MVKECAYRDKRGVLFKCICVSSDDGSCTEEEERTMQIKSMHISVYPRKLLKITVNVCLSNSVNLIPTNSVSFKQSTID